MRFNIVIRGRNCEKYIKKCLQSIHDQTELAWRAIVVLDAPDDNSVSQAISFVGENQLQHKIHIHVNKERKGLGYNIYNGPYLLKEIFGAFDTDIVAWIDADDYLNTKDALSIVRGKYENNASCVLTYGSYVKKSKGMKTRISKKYVGPENVRKGPWRFSHLKTMSWGLFRQLPKSCFQHKGKWIPAASDVALMLPAVEVAGVENCYHVSTPIYVWRDGYPGSTNKSRQTKYDKIIRKKKPLK